MFHGGSSFRKFSKFFFSKFQKCPKSFPKVSKRVLNVFGANFSKIFFAQCSVEGRVFKNFHKKYFQNSKKCPKVFSKVSKRVLNMFWGKIFEKFYAQCSMEGRVFENFPRNQKNSQNSKMPKSVPKSIQTCFRVIFSKKFYAQCSMEGRVFENFQIFFFKIRKCPKSFPKVSKHVLNMFWGKLFEKFLPSFPWNVEFSKFFKKKYFQNSKNTQKCSQKYPNVF